MSTFSLRRHRHIVGLRSDQVVEQQAIGSEAALRAMFGMPIPQALLQFILDLPDCVLYYRYDAVTRTGKTKTYSQFVLPSIEPGFGEECRPHMPASTVGYVRRFRELGLPPHYLPFVADSNKLCHLFCDLRQESDYRVVVAKSETAFDDKAWVVVASRFEDFVNSLRVDMKHAKSVLRLCGTEITPTFRAWLEAALGDDWQAKVEADGAGGKRRAT